MKYSEFLKANGITHEQAWNLLVRRCEEKKDKETLASWWKTVMEETSADEINRRYRMDLAKPVEINDLDEDAIFLATLDCWRNMEEQKFDVPSMVFAYVVELNC